MSNTKCPCCHASLWEGFRAHTGDCELFNAEQRIKTLEAQKAALMYEADIQKEQAKTWEAVAIKFDTMNATLNRAYHRPNCTSGVFGPYASCCRPAHAMLTEAESQISALEHRLKHAGDIKISTITKLQSQVAALVAALREIAECDGCHCQRRAGNAIRDLSSAAAEHDKRVRREALEHFALHAKRMAAGTHGREAQLCLKNDFDALAADSEGK